MTENKRFTITQDFEEHHKQIRDNGHIIMGCFVEQQAEVIVNLLNEQYEQIERLKRDFRALDEVKCELADENEQLKRELIEFKKCGKYVGDVKREDLDKVFKMSIYEVAEAFAYYEKRIKELKE